MPSLKFYQSQNGVEVRERPEEAIISKSISAWSWDCLSHLAKQWSVLKHSEKKLNYFLIKFLLRQSLGTNALHCCSAFHLKISKHTTTINSSSLFCLCNVVNTSTRALNPLLKLIHLGLGRDGSCSTRRHFYPVASKMEKQGASYLPS